MPVKHNIWGMIVVTGRLTKDEDQLQFLFQAVADNLKCYPQAMKRNLTEDSKTNETN